MNILEMEDTVKGYPDDRLMQEAQNPTGQIPQYLLISEVQRRADMRKRYQQQNNKQEEGTIQDQILREADYPPPAQMPPELPTGRGIAPDPNLQFPPPQNPNGELAPPDGVIRMAYGGEVPTMGIPWQGDTYQVNRMGYPTDEVAFQEYLRGKNYAVGKPRPTWGRTDNTILFDRQGNLLRTPETVEAARQSFDPDFAKYGDAFGMSILNNPKDVSQYQDSGLPNISLATLDAGSFGPQSTAEKNVGIVALAPEDSRQALALMDTGPVPDYDPEALKAQVAAASKPKLTGSPYSAAEKDANIYANVDLLSGPSPVDASRTLMGMVDTDPFVGTVKGMWDQAKEDWNVIHDTLAQAKTGKKSPVEPEKKAQYAGANKLDVQSQESPGDEMDKLAEGSGIDALLKQYGDLNYPDDLSPYQRAKNSQFEYSDLVDKTRSSSIDTSSVADKARKDAWTAAVMQIAGGIAGNDFGAGLRNAGIAMAQGNREANTYKMMGEQSKNEADRSALALELSGRRMQLERGDRLAALAGQEAQGKFERTVSLIGLDQQERQIANWTLKNSNEEKKMEILGITELLDQVKEKYLLAKYSADVEAMSSIEEEYQQLANRLKTLIGVGQKEE